MNHRYLIYGLVDPETHQLRYVGKSCQGLKRARAHAYPGYLSRDKSYCGNWIRSLLSKGLRYKIVVFQAFDDADILFDAERFWISYFRSIGHSLTNLTNGGEGASGRKVSNETRAKMRLANLGNKNALGKKQELSASQRETLAERARVRSADISVRAKISSTLAGRSNGPCKEETKEKISAKLKGRPGNPGSGRPRGSTEKIIQDPDGNLYYGLKAAADKFGITPSHLTHVLKGRRRNRWGLKEIQNGCS